LKETRDFRILGHEFEHLISIYSGDRVSGMAVCRVCGKLLERSAFQLFGYGGEKVQVPYSVFFEKGLHFSEKFAVVLGVIVGGQNEKDRKVFFPAKLRELPKNPVVKGEVFLRVEPVLPGAVTVALEQAL